MDSPSKSSICSVTRAVEWDRFVELSQTKAYTEPGKSILETLKTPTSWAAHLSAAQIMQSETQEITALLDRDALWGPLVELSDPMPILERLGRSAVLEIAELATLRRWLYAVDSWTQIPRDEIRGEKFRKTLSQLPDPMGILRILDQVLTPEGELSEKASPKLGALFAEIRHIKREISATLDQLIKTFSQKGILQENFSDVRDGRYVIPIKIASQNEVDGIIYEASASRQTVFVEPKEVSPLNNRLRQRQNDLIQEIFEILSSTSKKLHPYTQEIHQSVLILSHWDTVQAKARLGRNYSGKPIQVSEERKFNLLQTAHPLLWWSMPAESIIRNDLEFGSPTKTFLLTGPNTGGKTVLLKTLGLAGICARTGFPFPATDRPQVPFFEDFFADLGDPQSIENHVSSFSGHVMKFKEILECKAANCLILIDELNSATDPEEGAAFGRAVLETMMGQDAMIVTTTHDPHLKALAISDPRIMNASMAFDETARTPTYRMLRGVPGRSRALETAERLGISPNVVALARSYLSKEHNVFESMLAQLELDTQDALKARKQAVALQMEAEKLKKEWTTRTETSVSEMMDRTRQKLRRILEQAQDEVRETVRKLDEMKNRKSIDQTRSQLNDMLHQAVSKMDSALTEEAPEIAQLISRSSHALAPEVPRTASHFQVGSQVRIPKWKNTGTVLEIIGTKIRVAMGTLQMNLSAHEIEPILNRKPTYLTQTVQVSVATSSEIESKIDLRGVRLDDAMSQLQQYLDLVFRTATLAEVTVVHGLGTGALREGTHRLLGLLPYVRSFRDGGAGNGGTGATIVEFDRE